MKNAGIVEHEGECLRKDLDELGYQKINGLQTLMEFEGEDMENGPQIDRIKARKKKWKYQARNVEGRSETSEGIVKIKRPNSTMGWESPKPKISIFTSPHKIALSSPFHRATKAGTKLTFDGMCDR